MGETSRLFLGSLGSVLGSFGNVETFIQEWIETAKELGRPIPAPRGRLAFA